MTTLAALVTRLTIDVPAVDDVPSPAQYEQAVKDAVQEFSRRCGLIKYGEIAIVANTATYALADDFMKLISLESPIGVDGVVVTNTGLIPVSADWEEVYQIANGQITFIPTPTYSVTRDYKYKSAWVLDESDDYPDLGDEEAQIVMIKARQLALEKIGNAQAAAGIQRYSLGAVSVDKSGDAESVTKRLYALHGEFVEACERYNGAHGSA